MEEDESIFAILHIINYEALVLKKKPKCFGTIQHLVNLSKEMNPGPGVKSLQGCFILSTPHWTVWTLIHMVQWSKLLGAFAQQCTL